jgi:DNA-binding NtrC family response regulator
MGTLGNRNVGTNDEGAAPRVRRVFVAEDNGDIRELVTRALELDGYEVVGFPDGTTLVDYLGDALRPHSATAMPDFIVSDIRMPGFSGMDVLAALSRAEVEVPVILITAFGNEEMDEEAQRLGAVGFITKPFEMDDLRTALRYYLDHGRSEGQRARAESLRRQTRHSPSRLKH